MLPPSPPLTPRVFGVFVAMTALCVLSSACANSGFSTTPMVASTEEGGMAGFTMIKYSRRARPGGLIFVQIRTRPGAVCTVSLALPNGIWVQDFALAPTRANAEGTCVWSWHLPTDAPLGTAHLTVAAQGDARRYDVTIATAP
ncbi:MAG: hypothetical protein GXO56_01820 [Chloroflexi bacterium]|nr:hypothetical protein [Chloroflexota bacterium]